MSSTVRAIRWPELRWLYALSASHSSSVKVIRYAAHRGFNVTERIVRPSASHEVLARLQDDPLWTSGRATYAEASPFPHVVLKLTDRSRMGDHRYEFWYPAWVAGVLRLGLIAPKAFRRAVMLTTPAFREDLARVWTLSGDAGAVFALLHATLPEDAWADGAPFVGNDPL